MRREAKDRNVQVENLEGRRLFAYTGPTEGKMWDFHVDFGSHTTKPTSPGDFEVEIRWVDGQVSKTREIERHQDFDIYRAYTHHMYKDSGLTGHNQITIRNLKTGDTWKQSTIQQKVLDAPIKVTASDFNTALGGSYSGVVGSFTSECAYDTADEFIAYIYTPGNRTDGKITGGGGSFTVTGQNIPAGNAPGAQDFRVFIMSKDTVNQAATGTMYLSNQQPPQQMSQQAQQTSQKMLQGSVSVTNSPILQGWAEQVNWGKQQLQDAVQDAVKSFATGLTTDQKRPQLSLSKPIKNPFSPSFFDTGRMLRGIASVPVDLYKLGAYIVQNPQIFSKENMDKIAKGAIDGTNKAIGTVKDPVKLMGAINAGFNAFANIDAADFGGKWIGGTVMAKAVSALGGQAMSKLTPAQKVGTSAVYVGEGAEVYAVSTGTWTTIFNNGHNVEWINGALKGVNIQTNGTSCVNVVRAIENKLKYKITSSTPVPNSGLQSLKVIEDQFGKKFANTTVNDLVKQLTKNPGKEARGILALEKPGLHLVGNKYVYRPGHVLNVVYKPGQGVWLLDGNIASAYHMANPETMKLLSKYSGKMQWIKTF